MKSMIIVVAGLLFIGYTILPARSMGPAANGNVASASGGAHNTSLSLSFGAFDHGDGNITGQATFIDDADKTKFTIDVECLALSGNQADVGGTITKSSNPSMTVGTAAHFVVADNGEGTGIIDYFTPATSGGCGASVVPAALASDRGNIQVRFVAPDKECTKCPAGTHCAGNGECVGGGGGGGGLHCSSTEHECCGVCVPQDGSVCPACPPAPGK
jgi:hypothetical protein